MCRWFDSALGHQFPKPQPSPLGFFYAYQCGRLRSCAGVCERLWTSDFARCGHEGAVFSLFPCILSAPCPPRTQRSQQSGKFIGILINGLPCVGASRLENGIGRRFRINDVISRFGQCRCTPGTRHVNSKIPAINAPSPQGLRERGSQNIGCGHLPWPGVEAYGRGVIRTATFWKAEHFRKPGQLGQKLSWKSRVSHCWPTRMKISPRPITTTSLACTAASMGAQPVLTGRAPRLLCLPTPTCSSLRCRPARASSGRRCISNSRASIFMARQHKTSLPARPSPTP